MTPAQQRRWIAAGRALAQRDPVRFDGLLKIAEQTIRIHKKQDAAVRRRFAARR